MLRKFKSLIAGMALISLFCSVKTDATQLNIINDGCAESDIKVRLKIADKFDETWLIDHLPANSTKSFYPLGYENSEDLPASVIQAYVSADRFPYKTLEAIYSYAINANQYAGIKISFNLENDNISVKPTIDAAGHNEVD